MPLLKRASRTNCPHSPFFAFLLVVSLLLLLERLQHVERAGSVRPSRPRAFPRVQDNSRNELLPAHQSAAPLQRGYDAAAVSKWAKELATLGNCGQSKHGKRYRSLVCALVRNDIHMREFVVRNLLLGFCHIVISDNNQVSGGRDYNMTLLLQPFVEQGLVTHLPYNADGSQQFLDMETKADSARKCMVEYGNQADWVMDLDSDEYLLITKRAAAVDNATRSVGVLDEFLDEMEQKMPDTCGLEAPWRNMYGEHLVLNRPGLLMDTFQRICFSVSQKVIYRTDLATYQPPHWAHCKNKEAHKPRSVDSEERRRALPQYEVDLIHYYTKTVEEYIAKSEQSQPPYFRKMRDMYDTSGGSKCSNQPLPYDTEYKKAVRLIMQGLQAAQGGLPDGGQQLGPLPEYKPHSRDDYPLYLFLKVRVAYRSEWDEMAYLSQHPEVRTAIQENKFFDGLHHFIVEGFAQGLGGCWNDTRVLGGRAFCIK